ncbi:selenocysteine lyase-like [Dreissena polymorpha]|uniref:Selenocysteine lyase n=1 Tax=Dreissena polymorpha TaxID=45954 RepID=A0A9D3YFW2_DREPO|nr:selenocysteine lyase-like [Dreissena polymorpha]KAH3697991.1 hypothetical protein DPMN_085504 [Dreissena polymorpha]
MSLKNIGEKIYHINKMETKIYLDYNATTPLDKNVRETINDALEHCWGNPSSSHNTGKSAKRVIDEARRNVATMIGGSSSDVIFTSGGTEANNMIILSAVHHFRKLYGLTNSNGLPSEKAKTHNSLASDLSRLDKSPKKRKLSDGDGDEIQHGVFYGDGDHKIRRLPHIISSYLEHPAVNVFLEHLKSTGQADVTYAEISQTTGRVEVEGITKAIRPNTILVTVMLANNETGIIQPVREICEAIRNLDRSELETEQIYVHTDAAQAIGKISVDVQSLGVDYLTIVGHKFYGPRIGAVYTRGLAKSETPLFPVFYGGGQEKGLRAGTENTGMIAGLGKASEIVNANLTEFQTHMKMCRDYLESRLTEHFKERVHFNGKFPGIESLPNTCNVSILGKNLQGHRVLEKCKTIEASVGAACHAQNKPSAILLAVGIPEDIARNALRLSLGRETTLADVDLVVEDLVQAVQELDAE